MPRMMWPILACLGNFGVSNSQMCKDRSCFPSGIFTFFGVFAGWTLMMYALVVKKLLVALMSPIPKLLATLVI